MSTVLKRAAERHWPWDEMEVVRVVREPVGETGTCTVAYVMRGEDGSLLTVRIAVSPGLEAIDRPRSV